MALHFYLVPTDGGVTSPRVPKYFGDPTVRTFLGAIRYGPDHYLVGADLPDADHATVSGFSDVFVIPPLNQAVGGNPTLNQVRNELKARSIPGDWVQATTTWRQVVGRVGRCAQILQRMFSTLGRHLFGGGNALSTTLTTSLRDDFIATGQSFNFNVNGITTSVTVETALLLLADQFPPFVVAGETF